MRFLCLLCVVIIGLSTIPASAIDLSNYQLTELQKNLLLQWEMEKRFDETKLLAFAQNFHNYNTRPTVYIPPHTPEDLRKVTQWAEGRAFVFFARFTPYMFDAEQYEADCPYPALFNFGLATEKMYLSRDVLEISLRTFNLLAYYLRQSPENFPQVYLKKVKESGFGSYVTEPIEVSNSTLSSEQDL